ncbi:precorrin-3B C(17)-methyltransferase [Leptolyngbya sp. AN02str]|uniref:precorrin-3B C(17)-methyltransferase n=1 Tax=Leptolyngbya sp. AN02str TaxID=3423363 RepID=UPI003D31C2C6
MAAYLQSMVLNNFQAVAAIAPTLQSVRQLQPLWETGHVTLWVPQSLQDSGAIAPHSSIQSYPNSISDLLPTLWNSHQALVFGLATGATVRLIAPLLQHKQTDPAVVVVDAAGQFVISLCGGHVGGADALTQAIAPLLKATPVLTGAANALHLPGIDVLGQPFGWNPGTGEWTAVSAAIAHHQPIQVIQTAGSALWQQHLPADHPFQFESHPLEPHPSSTAAQLYITPHSSLPTPHSPLPTVSWHPRVLWLGIGCERGTSRAVIEAAIQQALAHQNLAEGAIAGIATLDLKADEVALVELCGDRQFPLRCFTAAELSQVAVPTPSTVVAAEVGTPSVAEAAALLAAGAEAQLLVNKHIVRLEGQPGAATVAIAQAQQEYIGRTGQLWLVGTGPGKLNQITPAAQAAIAQADVVIGYSLYIDLIQPLLRPGQIVEALPITQERQRAQRAIELAEWGLTVAVVSSGDCGIYGMAGLVLEELRSHGWDGNSPSIQVFPGITALQAAASRVGAPLMHDFCAISLSDLLTPWNVIETRLHAAAQADFVTALYNPRSRTRTEQMAIAQRIFLRYRSPETPVALVQSAYRPTEHITLTTLGELPIDAVDMLTTVLIGNQSSQFHKGWIITPRGYLGKDVG